MSVLKLTNIKPSVLFNPSFGDVLCKDWFYENILCLTNTIDINVDSVVVCEYLPSSFNSRNKEKFEECIIRILGFTFLGLMSSKYDFLESLDSIFSVAFTPSDCFISLNDYYFRGDSSFVVSFNLYDFEFTFIYKIF